MNKMKFIRITSTELMAIILMITALTNIYAVAQQNILDSDTASTSYLSWAGNFFDRGMEAHQQAQTYSSMMPNENPRPMRMLHESIDKVTELINNYKKNGLSNLANLPNLPGLSTLMRVPDKLLRLELSMLQDEIRMAQEMMQNPISATINAPRDLASMLSRMAEQLEQ